MRSFFVGLLSVVLFVFITFYVLTVDFETNVFPILRTSARTEQNRSLSSKWIVITTVNSPTDDIKNFLDGRTFASRDHAKTACLEFDASRPRSFFADGTNNPRTGKSVRLAKIPGWTVVVVGDKKTPKNWSVPGVHFLSVDTQLSLGYGIVESMPYKSYTRKNIGYLYAIENGAEWIYDTDDDNKPYGNGMAQFDYSEFVSGLRYGYRYGARRRSSTAELFNPYLFYGHADMWPRGFPLERIQNHTNELEKLRLCRKMRSAAVQQGLVHKDPDVDAIYRLLHADKKTGLKEEFNPFAPPVVIDPGIYAPWNSQNTLFHRRAFFTMFLPTTVQFRVTDIWRSYFAQKLLHIIGETISFNPANAVQFRNAHDYLADFESESDVYLKSGKLVDFLNQWQCKDEEISSCTISLAVEFNRNNFWNRRDVDLVRQWIEDLKAVGYKFPLINHPSKYSVVDEESRNVNCRRASVDFSSIPTKEVYKSSQNKINVFGELSDWCAKADFRGLAKCLPSPHQLTEAHENNHMLSSLQKTVLVISSNYPWNKTIGLLQRIYQPYFGVTIFCGSWYPDRYVDEVGFPMLRKPFNYIHLSAAEMTRGYYAYYCLAKAKELRIQGTTGYFIMADDTTFNFWNEVNLSTVFHPNGLGHNGNAHWWGSAVGLKAAKAAVKLFKEKYKNDTAAQRIWKQFHDDYQPEKGTPGNVSEFMTEGDGWSVSDLYYVPSSLLEYHAGLMEVFFEGKLFHEIAISKFLHSVVHKSLNSTQYDLLYGKGGRGAWHRNYHEKLYMMHPIKFSRFKNADTRRLFCITVLSAFERNLIRINKQEQGNNTVA